MFTKSRERDLLFDWIVFNQRRKFIVNVAIKLNPKQTNWRYSYIFHYEAGEYSLHTWITL